MATVWAFGPYLCIWTHGRVMHELACPLNEVGKHIWARQLWSLWSLANQQTRPCGNCNWKDWISDWEIAVRLKRKKNIYKIICGKLSSCFMNSYFLTYGPKLQESIGQLWNWLSSENIFINGNCRLKFRKFQLVVAQLGLDWPWHKYRSTAWLRQYYFLPNG